MQYKVIEITEEFHYLDQIVKLEEKVLRRIEEQGKTGELFITGKEDIKKYIDSGKNTVEAAINNKNEIISVAYITQGQELYTYNDITKYFKYSNEYKNYVREQYSKTEYRKKLMRMYEYKINGYKYAKLKIEEEHPEYKGRIEDFLKNEIKSNGFHEKSELREKVNRYMYEYIYELSKIKREPEILEQYNQFYWSNIEDVNKEFGINIESSNVKNKYVQKWENI